MIASPIGIENYKRIVLLTGAGISVASGLRTYRGPNGLWEEGDLERVSHAKNMPQLLPELWTLYSALRTQVAQTQPNAAHLAIADLQNRLQPAQSLTLLTQNVDGLHARAGSRDALELHGSGLRSRCTNESCSSQPFEDAIAYETVPLCAQCGSALRPDVTLFGEQLPVETEWRAKKSLRDCDLFIAAGTSGTVEPAARFVRNAKYAGARTILVNLTPMPEPDPNYDQEILGRAEEILPILLATG